MIQPKYLYAQWGIRGHSQSPGRPGPDQRDVYLCFDSAVCDMLDCGNQGPSRPWTPGSTRHDTSHSSCPHLIEIFSQPLLVLCSQWPLLCRTLLSRLFSLRSVHWSLFSVSLAGFFSPPCLSGIGIHYLSLEMELLSNAHTCQYKNCPSHIGGNSLPMSEASHD